ncbi:TPA: hypothetical protein ACGU4U_004303 [Vibrio vulnificus]
MSNKATVIISGIKHPNNTNNKTTTALKVSLTISPDKLIPLVAYNSPCLFDLSRVITQVGPRAYYGELRQTGIYKFAKNTSIIIKEIKIKS